jgi:hypothetical protein
MRIKRILVGLLSLAVVGLSVQPSFARLFHHCCGCGYSTYICCRPYNAFTPVCFGNITGLGCCPVALNCCQPSGGPSWYDSGCGGACSASPSQSLPTPGNFTPPPPTPMKGAVSYWWNQQEPYAMVPQAMVPQAMMPQPMVLPYNVQQTSYYPGYYNPGYYWPTAPAPMPNYWYGR